MVELSCCNRIPHPNLKYGTGYQSRVPPLLQQKCVRNACTEYGDDRKLTMTTCELLSTNTIVINVME